MGDQVFDDDQVLFRQHKLWTTKNRNVNVRWNFHRGDLRFLFNNEIVDEGVETKIPFPEYSVTVTTFLHELQPHHRGILQRDDISDTEKGYIVEGIAPHYFDFTPHPLSSAPADGFESNATVLDHRPLYNFRLYKDIMSRKARAGDRIGARRSSRTAFLNLQEHMQLLLEDDYWVEHDPFELKYNTSKPEGQWNVNKWKIPKLQYYNIVANYGTLGCVTQYQGRYILGVTLEFGPKDPTRDPKRDSTWAANIQHATAGGVRHKRGRLK